MVNEDIRDDAAIAILTKNASEIDSKGTLACMLPWGHGWGWSTLPNGVWSGGKLNKNYKVKMKSAATTFLSLASACWVCTR